MILAPKYLRAKQPYQFSVSTYDFNKFSKLRVTIENDYSENDYSESGEPIQINKDVHLKSSQNQLVEIDVSDFKYEDNSSILRICLL